MAALFSAPLFYAVWYTGKEELSYQMFSNLVLLKVSFFTVGMQSYDICVAQEDCLQLDVRQD